jgi:hypothetical protein
MQKAYSELQQQLIDSCNSIMSQLRDEDIQMGSMTTEDNLLGQAHQPGCHLLIESIGVPPQNELMTHHHQEASALQIDHTKVVCIVAACDDTNMPCKHKF